MGKITYEIYSDLMGQKFSTVEKSDQEQASRMSRRMSRLVARKPDLAESKPEIYAKYKDREAEMQERSNATRERHREEKPGVVHEDLEQDDGSEDVSRSEAHYVKLNKGGVLSLPQMREEGKKHDKENVGGGVVDKDLFYAFRKKAPTEKKTDKPAELTNKARFFVLDIFKGGSHKYIRKYQKNGEWIYIYHEGEQHGRMAQEDIDAHHHLAQHGEEHERSHHQELLDRIQTMTDEDVGHHKLLAEHGNEAERAHHTSILKILGHKKDEDKKDGLSKLENTVTQAERVDEADKELPAAKRAEVLGDMKKEIERTFTHLNQHRDSLIAQKILALDKNKMLEEIGQAKSVREILKVSQAITKKLEVAQGDLVSQSLSSEKTYGNRLHSETLKTLVKNNVVPQSYADEHKRESRQVKHEIKGLTGHREREEQRVREQAEQDRREIGEYADKVTEVTSYFNKTLSTADKKKLSKGIKNLFGVNFSMAAFASALNPNPLSTSKIEVDENFYRAILNAGESDSRGGRGNCTFRIKDATTGERITNADRDFRVDSDGAITWHNGIFSRPSNEMLKKHSGMSKGLYNGVETFLRGVTKDLPKSAKDKCNIHMSAANQSFGDGFKGALLWAKHYYKFSEDRSCSQMKGNFKEIIASRINAVPEIKAQLQELQTRLPDFKQPYQFVRTGIQVTKSQAEAFIGRRMDFDFNQQFDKKVTCDIGELILIKSGQWFEGVNYFHRTEGVDGELNKKRADYYSKDRSDRPSAQDAQRAFASVQSGRVREFLSANIAEGRSMVMTVNRLRQMEAWSKTEVEEFYRHAPLSRGAKQRVKEVMDRIGG